MKSPINMIDLVKELASRPRGKSCIVLTKNYSEQKSWSSKLASQTNSEHIDLLDIFGEDDSLAGKIKDFSAQELFNLLENRSIKQVLIISGMEFIKATWIGQSNAVNEFARRVQTWDKEPCLLFVLQYDKTLANYDFGHRHQYRYIVDQEDTFAL